MLHVLSETDKRLAKATRDRRKLLGFPEPAAPRPIIKKEVQQPIAAVEQVNKPERIDYSPAPKDRIEFLLFSMKLPAYEGGKTDTTISEIIRVVARFYDVRVPVLRSFSRPQQVVIARHAAMWLARELTGSSYPVIARSFGRRDHTSIIFAFQKIEHLRKTNPEIQSQTDQLLSALRSHNPQGDSDADQNETTD